MLYYNYSDPLLNYISAEERAINEYLRLEYKLINKERRNKGVRAWYYQYLSCIRKV
jgi:hypothetical protein